MNDPSLESFLETPPGPLEDGFTDRLLSRLPAPRRHRARERLIIFASAVAGIAAAWVLWAGGVTLTSGAVGTALLAATALGLQPHEEAM